MNVNIGYWLWNRWQLKEYRDVFCGNEMVDWLLLMGLARDRSQAEKYGQGLLDGGIINHVDGRKDFHDQPYFYSFTQWLANANKRLVDIVITWRDSYGDKRPLSRLRDEFQRLSHEFFPVGDQQLQWSCSTYLSITLWTFVLSICRWFFKADLYDLGLLCPSRWTFLASREFDFVEP